MKFLFKAALIAFTWSLFLASCSKQDIVTEDSISTELASDATTPDLSKCKMRLIYMGSDENPYEYSGLFSYNRVGNPYSILFSPGGVPDYYFYYDSKNRLIKHTEFNYGLEFQHFYRHNSSGQIIIDSAVNPSSDAKDTSIYVSHIEYDAKGRVVKETIIDMGNDGTPNKFIRRPTYTYDNRGNIGVIGWKSSSYDYKINPLRQNPIFQFILRNYSMNNPAKQRRYNSKGLPLSLSPSNDPFFGGFIDITKIVYDCQ